MRCARRCARRCGVALVLAACLLGTGAAAMGAAAAQGGAGRPLAEIVKDLGSAEFAVRERAQGELAKVPREQLDALQEAQRQTTDAEVKVRLEARIGEIVVDGLLHPPKLSVDVKDTPLAEFAAILNKQMGAQYVEVDKSVPGVPPRVTLKAQDQPFWEILQQVMEQAPASLKLASTRTQSETINTIQLVPVTPARQKSHVPVVDGMMMTLGILGNPASGQWQVVCGVTADPRVRLTGYLEMLQVDKAIVQDGREIKPIPATGRKVATGIPFSSASGGAAAAAFASIPGVTAIKELRGSVVVEVAENMHFVSIDLTKELKPVATPWATFTVEQAGNGDLTVTMEPPRGAHGAGNTTTGSGFASRFTARVLDKEGNAIIRAWSSTTTTTLPTSTKGPTLLEIAIPWKTWEVRLPVIGRDLEVPARPALGRGTPGPSSGPTWDVRPGPGSRPAPPAGGARP
jgi:hypothetical protein